jgi:DNA-nicking Smr family endonuclease
MKIGDKVRFLNTTGGGVVKGFQGKDIVLVEDQEGFDIPILIRETVVIEPTKDIQVKSPKPEEVFQVSRQVKEEEYKPEETKEGEQLGIYLAYLPNDIKSLSTTNLECYLINDSNYYLSFNYMNRTEQGWLSRHVGNIEPNTKLFIEEFDKSEINNIEHVCLQFFAYKKNKEFSLKNAYSVDIHIDTVKFYKLHSFKENDYFDDEAIIYPVVRRDLAEKELTISAKEIEEAMKQKDRPRIQPIEKKEKKPILEVDLHITELVDNTNGLSSGDMLEYQIKKFNEVMEDNKRNKGQKIVFIHGKGDGVLKNAVLKELKTKYQSAYYQDASFREYGYGATMVTIK